MRELSSFHPSEIAGEFISQNGPFAHHGELLYQYDREKGIWEVVIHDQMLRKIQLMNDDRYFMRVIKNGDEITKYLVMTPKAQDDVAKCVERSTFTNDATFAASSRTGVAFINRYVNVEDGKVVDRDHSPLNYALTHLPIEYDATIQAPNFKAMLDNLFAEDAPELAAEKQRVLAQFYGASLFGFAPKREQCIILSGSGSNGKSTFQEIMQDALFHGISKSVSPDKWDNEYYVASMHGLRLNTVSELPSAAVLDSQIFKAVVTGDELQGRHPGGRPFSMRPMAGHVFAANELPATNDTTAGFWRRFLVIDFTRHFTSGTREDVKGPVMAEVPGILNWAIAGAIDALSQSRYTVPSSHAAAMLEWKKDADAVAGFVDAAGVVGDAWTSFGSLYASYRDWAPITGHAIMSDKKFAKRMRSMGIAYEKRADTTYYRVSILDRKQWRDVIGGGQPAIALAKEAV